ncbi:MAG: hypothetical protein ACPL3S_04860, partial [Halothiobacillaceae bacterium]
MIDFKEHLYEDDPSQGHPDVRTRLREGYYFFLGNGRIQAAVQVSPAGEGTPLGLLIMDPERLGKKREALSFESQTGLEATMLKVELGEGTYTASGSGLQVRWSSRHGAPAVEATWQAGSARVREFFSCPLPEQPLLLREVVIHLPEEGKGVILHTGLRDQRVRKELRPAADGAMAHSFCYRLENGQVRLEPEFPVDLPSA